MSGGIDDGYGGGSGKYPDLEVRRKLRREINVE